MVETHIAINSCELGLVFFYQQLALLNQRKCPLVIVPQKCDLGFEIEEELIVPGIVGRFSKVCVVFGYFNIFIGR